MSGYKGVGEFDATTGQYNQLSPESIAKNVDGYKLGEEVASKMKAKGFEKEIDQVSGDWVYRNKVSGETLTPKEIMDASYGRMVNDSGYMDMLRQEAE